jgi:uncharacterized protein YndB with AHSA1/START domain
MSAAWFRCTLAIPTGATHGGESHPTRMTCHAHADADAAGQLQTQVRSREKVGTLSSPGPPERRIRKPIPNQGTPMPNTVRLHRVLRAPPERVYRAFLDADAKAKWLPPNGFTGKVHELDARVGGSYRMSFTNFSTGQTHSFGGTYRELVPNQRIRHSDKFEDPNLPGEIMVTITLKPVSCGTELQVVQEGLPDVIPLEHCYLGWQESLVLLAKLVEANVQG